jgi:hypothetical protein
MPVTGGIGVREIRAGLGIFNVRKRKWIKEKRK